MLRHVELQLSLEFVSYVPTPLTSRNALMFFFIEYSAETLEYPYNLLALKKRFLFLWEPIFFVWRLTRSSCIPGTSDIHRFSVHIMSLVKFSDPS